MYENLYPVLAFVFLFGGLCSPGRCAPDVLTSLARNGTTSYTTCSGTLYDNGGATGPYSLNATGAMTLPPATAGNKIRVDFT
ncbi:hypothetical protein [Hymenobacter sp. BRD67]|uniref:hypothetical protein n=1 Tax=Hymenobacter sp. BRD67 TaxID=2675877 RepID=UPI001565A6F6|nr:hypothetical protein [Hymenobacter sp. BRD67]QKG53592.1 hypothetical protein GKZ67_14535 [Hymenobacter sp. BRD67]